MNAFKIVEKLEAKGFTREQAEGILEAGSEYMNENLANKNDLKDLIHKIEQMENRIIIKLGGIVIAGIGILGFILKH